MFNEWRRVGEWGRVEWVVVQLVDRDKRVGMGRSMGVFEYGVCIKCSLSNEQFRGMPTLWTALDIKSKHRPRIEITKQRADPGISIRPIASWGPTLSPVLISVSYTLTPRLTHYFAFNDVSLARLLSPAARSLSLSVYSLIPKTFQIYHSLICMYYAIRKLSYFVICFLKSIA